ncbi:hypothetical protein IFO70_34810 [Phormidium tenue FACHB-886]|nr:hypothetical protein [Phormidium tenue FACHB-886]
MLNRSHLRFLLPLVLIFSFFTACSFQLQPTLQGIDIIGFDDQGRELTFQIRDIEIDPLDPQQEIYLYTVFYRASDRTWHNLCQPNTHHVSKAVVLQGAWDQTGDYQAQVDRVTFSCTNGAIGKCLRFGYKPWKTQNGQSHYGTIHQACMRLIRADYCGNGIGHTQDGTPINFYDRLGIQIPDAVPNMSFEAAWGVDGAYSIHHTRFAQDLADVQRLCSNRLAQRDRQAAIDPLQQQFAQALLFNDSIEQLNP